VARDGVAAVILPGLYGDLLFLIAALCIEDGGHWLGAGHRGQGHWLRASCAQGYFNSKTFSWWFREGGGFHWGKWGAGRGGWI